MDKKTITLAFGGGIRNVPSDRVCDDNELAYESGMMFVDGEHHVLRLPIGVGGVAKELMFVHDYSNYTHYLCKDGTSLCWVDSLGDGATVHSISGFTLSGYSNISAIGNTVVISTDNGLKYLLWDGDAYKAIGDIPELDVESSLTPVLPNTFDFNMNEHSADIGDYIWFVGSSIAWSYYDTAKAAVTGHVSKMITKVKEKGCFPYAFWVRYGLRMYDESVTMLTAPQLMFASVRANNNMVMWNDERSFVNSWNYIDDMSPAQPTPRDRIVKFHYDIRSSRLSFKINTDLSAFSDIVRGVVVYASDDVMPFVLDGDWKLSATGTDAVGKLVKDYMVEQRNALNPSDNHPLQYYSVNSSGGSGGTGVNIVRPEMLTDKEIMKALTDRSQFYELCELRIDEIDTNWKYADELLEKNALVNLTARTQLAHDDFYDHTKMIAQVMLSYNGRLQLGNIERSFYPGYGRLFPSYDTVRSSVDIYVKIRTDEGVRVVKKTYSDFAEFLGIWFYYPDPRAFELIVDNGSLVYKYPLREHPYLNGAYLFRCLPDGNMASLDGGTLIGEAPDVSTGNEHLPGYVVTSEVNNPYYFPVDGWNRIGSGVIRALGVTTDALSEGQFGQFPLIAFTSEGVWAMSLDNEGLYDTIHPISREVITEEGHVAQTDNAIYFISERGLAVVKGRTVALVNEHLMGKVEDLDDFEEDAAGINEFLFSESLSSSSSSNSSGAGGAGGSTVKRGMAYDYKNALLWIWRSDSDYAWVHSLKSGAFSIVGLSARWSSVHVLYPDTLVQQAGGNVLSFLKSPEVNKDTRTYDGCLLSRPVKMKDILHQKRIVEMMHHWNLEGGSFEVSLWGSDDLTDWREVDELGGMGWKYWRMKLEFSGMGATAVYSGTTIVYGTERGHRMREEGEWVNPEDEDEEEETDGDSSEDGGDDDGGDDDGGE